MSSRWNQIREAPARLRSRTRARLGRARSIGRDGWVQLRTRALVGAEEWVDRAGTWPGIGRLAGVAGRLVDAQRERWNVLPVDGWDTLNARDAMKAVAGLDAVGLRIARRHEAAAKNRVTVVRAIDEQLEKRFGVARPDRAASPATA